MVISRSPNFRVHDFEPYRGIPKSATFHFRWTVDAFVWLSLAEYIHHGIFPQDPPSMCLIVRLFFSPVFEKVNASILLDPSFFKLSRPDPGRNYLKCYSAGYFEEQKGILWHQHKQELDKWHGPFMDDAGRQPLGDKSDVRKHGDFYDWFKGKITGNHSFSH